MGEQFRFLLCIIIYSLNYLPSQVSNICVKQIIHDVAVMSTSDLTAFLTQPISCFQFEAHLPFFVNDIFVSFAVLTSSPDVTETVTMRINVIFYLTNGSMHFTVENDLQSGLSPLGVATGRQKTDCLSDYGTCTDAQWHHIRQAIIKNSVRLSSFTWY